MIRKSELFTKQYTKEKTCVAKVPPMLFPQERDWTCSIACIRTLTSAFGSGPKDEDWYINNFKLEPGPHYSKDIKEKEILKGYTVEYGCDYNNFRFDNLIKLLGQGYYIMVEGMINYSHWLVLLGYYTLGSKDDLENNFVLLYDPYYDELKLVRAEEFIEMWRDGDYANTGVNHDFIAIYKWDTQL